MGYAKEYHVERYFPECINHRLAPITPHLALCYIADRVLGCLAAEELLKRLVRRHSVCP